MTLLLALAVLAVVAPGPRTPVVHFLQPASPADLCSQLTPRYRKELDRQYGPCLQTVGQNPKATRLVFLKMHATGAKGTAEVRYTFRGRRYHERFTLVRLNGRWKIDDARLLA